MWDFYCHNVELVVFMEYIVGSLHPTSDNSIFSHHCAPHYPVVIEVKWFCTPSLGHLGFLRYEPLVDLASIICYVGPLLPGNPPHGLACPHQPHEPSLLLVALQNLCLRLSAFVVHRVNHM